MILNLVSAKYCSGLGDLLLWSWLTQANNLEYYSLGYKANFLEFCGLTVHRQPQPKMKDPSFAYRKELAELGRKPRYISWCEYLRIKPELHQPHLKISPQAEEWAASRAVDILLFPQTAWKAREYPPAYWIDLYWQLRDCGYSVLVCLQKDQQEFRRVRYCWGYAYDHIAALIEKSKLIIGNDSMPCHLGGTLGKKCFALCGPTKPTVFSHLPSVECLSITPENLPCVGCHFSRNHYRAACDQGCQALLLLQPQTIFQRVVSHLDGV